MEMSYCYEQGIPHSEFLDWTPEDRAKVLAFMLEKASRCDMCGTAEWEWDADRRAYEPVEKFCMGCYLKHMANEGGGSMPGTNVVMEPSRSRKSAERHERMKREATRGRRDT
jgi:hypothetical protein